LVEVLEQDPLERLLVQEQDLKLLGQDPLGHLLG
jgi:hypothetical protein